jgi:hypothetical protein
MKRLGGGDEVPASSFCARPRAWPADSASPSARLEFQRMHGEQEAAFTNTLPLCRGTSLRVRTTRISNQRTGGS